MTKTQRLTVQFSVVILSAVALLLFGLVAFTRQGLQGVQVPTAPLDAIVALTGGSNRIETGFALLEKDLGKKLFISGVYRGVEVRELLDRLQKKDHASFSCCVDLGFEADDTQGNARETAEWMKKNGYKSLYLVTAGYHMERALLEFRHAAPWLEISPYPVVPAGTDMANWWRADQSRNLIIREYLKYIAVLILRAVTVSHAA